jgi:hypothetical protein
MGTAVRPHLKNKKHMDFKGLDDEAKLIMEPPYPFGLGCKLGMSVQS